MQPAYWVGAGLFFLLAGGIGVYTVSASPPHSFKEDAMRINEVCTSFFDDAKKECITHEISKIIPSGIPHVFRVIDVIFEGGQVKGCHYALHPVGEAAYALYAETGDSDYMVPDAAMCNYGFFHGFIIALMRETNDLTQAARFCESLSDELLAERPALRGECYHGVGHGVLDVYLGKPGDVTDPAWVRAAFLEAVPRTLAACELMTDERANTEDCYSGIFHEARMLQEERGWYTDSENPLWLCDEFEGEYRARCIGNMDRLFFKIFPEIRAEDVVAEAQKLYGDEYESIAHTVRRFANHGIADRKDPNDVLRECREIVAPYQAACVTGEIASILENAPRGREYEVALSFCMDAELHAGERGPCVEQVFNYAAGIYPSSNIKQMCRQYADLRPEFCRTI